MATRDDEPRNGGPGPMGRDRARDGRSYYERDADEASGPSAAPGPDGRGGSMGGGLAAREELTGEDAQAALGEPAAGAREHIAGDSQGGSLTDGSAADSQKGAVSDAPQARPR